MNIDHAVVLVEELDAAAREWRAMGFTITPGGVHTGGVTHNALVCFADGSYIELLAFLKQDPTHRWSGFRGFWGPIDFALGVGSLDEFSARLDRVGLHYSTPYDGGRTRPDGVELRWRGAMPVSQGLGLPFLIQDVTPRTLRVPTGVSINHQNGALGINQIRNAALDVPAVRPYFAALLGEPTGVSSHGIVFQLGKGQVRVSQPGPNTPEATFVSKRGAGPFAITIVAPEPIVILPKGLSQH